MPPDPQPGYPATRPVSIETAPTVPHGPAPAAPRPWATQCPLGGIHVDLGKATADVAAALERARFEGFEAGRRAGRQEAARSGCLLCNPGTPEEIEARERASARLFALLDDDEGGGADLQEDPTCQP